MRGLAFSDLGGHLTDLSRATCDLVENVIDIQRIHARPSQDETCAERQSFWVGLFLVFRFSVSLYEV